MIKVIQGTTKDGQAELAEAINTIRRGEALEVQVVLERDEVKIVHLQSLAKALEQAGEDIQVEITGSTMEQVVVTIVDIPRKYYRQSR